MASLVAPLRRIMIVLGACFAASLFILKAQTTPFIVASPTDGQSVNAGGVIQVTLVPSAGLSVTEIQIWSPIASYTQHSGNSFTVTIPNDINGPVALLIVGKVSDGSEGAVTRTINVAVSQTLNAIVVSPSIVRLVSAGTAVGLAQTRLGVLGQYADGMSRDISKSAQLSLTSSNTRVATVDATGLVSAVAPGQATIIASIGSIIGNARVQVNIFELPGDFTGDGAVDQADLQLLLKALNTPATGPGDPRDLNNDGKIDALDARILATLCSRQACVVQ